MFHTQSYLNPLGYQHWWITERIWNNVILKTPNRDPVRYLIVIFNNLIDILKIYCVMYILALEETFVLLCWRKEMLVRTPSAEENRKQYYWIPVFIHVVTVYSCPNTKLFILPIMLEKQHCEMVILRKSYTPHPTSSIFRKH